MKSMLNDDYTIIPTNKYHVLRCVQCSGPINRSAIAKKVHLSIPAVMTITDDLINRGVVEVVGKARGGAGKQPELLSVVADSEFRVGVDIGRGAIRVVVVNQLDEVSYYLKHKVGFVQPAEVFVNWLCDVIKTCIEESNVNKDYIVGIGIAMPGLIEQEQGYVVFSPDFGWSDVPLMDWASRHLSYPIVVENANRALALSEGEWGRCSPRTRNHTFLCINIGHGIGGAILQNTQLYYGSSGTSGEIGHISVSKNGPLCMCGNHGCLEAVASGDAIADQARQMVKNGAYSLLSKRFSKALDQIDAKAVFEAANDGDATALSIVDKATEYIGTGLAIAVNILDPELIVLCGGLTRNGGIFFDRVKDSMQRQQMRHSGRNVKLYVSTKGEYSTAIGAARVVEYNGWRVPAYQHLYSIT